jgi:hypothetical protein
MGDIGYSTSVSTVFQNKAAVEVYFTPLNIPGLLHTWQHFLISQDRTPEYFRIANVEERIFYNPVYPDCSCSTPLQISGLLLWRKGYSTILNILGLPKNGCSLPLRIFQDCYCGGKDIPGGYTPDQIPQFVLLTFDDAVNDLNQVIVNIFQKRIRTYCPLLL